MNADYTGLFHALRPEAHLVIGAVLVLGFDLAWARHRPANRHHVALLLGTIALLVAGYAAATQGASGKIYGGAFMIDQLAILTRVGVIGLAALALALLPNSARLRHPAAAPSEALREGQPDGEMAIALPDLVDDERVGVSPVRIEDQTLPLARRFDRIVDIECDGRSRPGSSSRWCTTAPT